MSKIHMLRALVNERLTAAAEEIFALVEKTILELEEELSQSKELNNRNQELLDQVLNPRVVAQRVQASSFNPEHSFQQGISETFQIKQETVEQSIKEEEEQPSEVCATVSVKSEENQSSCEFYQRYTQHTQHTQWGANGEVEDQSGHVYSKTEEQAVNNSYKDCDNISFDAENWEAPENSSAAQMETEDIGDYAFHIQSKDTRRPALNFQDNKCDPAALESSATANVSRFSNWIDLTVHKNTHMENELSDSMIYEKNNDSNDMKRHMRIHTEEKPHSCTVCKKAFKYKYALNVHLRIHTGEKPYICSVCEKAFRKKCWLTAHSRIHTGEKPYRCPVCEKAFKQKCELKAHISIHTEDKPYRCAVCEKSFYLNSRLKKHMKTHESAWRGTFE